MLRSTTDSDAFPAPAEALHRLIIELLAPQRRPVGDMVHHWSVEQPSPCYVAQGWPYHHTRLKQRLDSRTH